MSESDETRAPMRLLCIGESGSGKTGSLLALAEAGFILHILDADHKARDLFDTILIDRVTTGSLSKESANSIRSRIDIEAVGELMSVDSKGKPKIKGEPKAFSHAGEILGAWGEQKFDRSHIIVIDPFSKLSEYCANVIAKLKGHDPVFQDYPDIYNRLRPMLELLTSWNENYINTGEQLDCHVIVLTHINLYEVRKATGEKTKAGKITVDETAVIDTIVYPSAIGQALSPKIPTYFNSMLVYRLSKVKHGERLIQLLASDMTPVKTPAISFAKTQKTLPVETGLAAYFAACGAKP